MFIIRASNDILNILLAPGIFQLIFVSLAARAAPRYRQGVGIPRQR